MYYPKIDKGVIDKMRISNLQFGKGSIIYAKFPPDLDYLNGRPLVVISDHIPVYDCYWVVKCGTKGKAGIAVSLFNYQSGDYIGGQQVTTIYPYNVYTVNSSQILSCIGTLDRFIMAELDEAIEFFRGRSNKVPAFLKDYETELTGVIHQPAMASYMRIDEQPGHEYRDAYDAKIFPVQNPDGSNGWNIPTPPADPEPKPADPETPTTKPKAEKSSKKVPKKTVKKTLSDDIPEDKIAEFLTLNCKFGKGEKVSVKVLTSVFNAWANMNVSVVGFSRVMNNYLTRINASAKREKVSGAMTFVGIGISSEPIKKAYEMAPMNPELFSIRDTGDVRFWASMNRTRLDKGSDKDSLFKCIGQESTLYILSRQASVGAVQNKYGIGAEEAEELMNDIYNAGLALGNSLVTKIMKRGLNPMNLTEIEKVSVVLACKVYGLSGSPKVRVRFNQLIQETMKKYHIDFQEKQVWKDIIVH